MKKLTYLLFCLLLGVGLVNAQTMKVTGVVISSDDGEPVIGASVIVKNTTTGTVTDYDGVFKLDVPNSAKTLVISYVGMIPQEVAVSSNVRVTLKSDTQKLDEVVVVAYGTQSAKTVTASISSVRGDDLKNVPSPSLDQMLQGRASGLSITTPSAGVGQAPVVRVRGVNSITSGTQPLYVVDGMPIESGELSNLGNANPLADINPSDITSIDVLKDAAAAALYGSRAANGVILITTKQGTKGSLKVSYDGYVGFSNRTKFIDMMNAQEYVDFKNLAVKNHYGSDEVVPTGGTASSYGKKAFNMMPDGNGGFVDSQWSDAIFQNGFEQNQSVSINGGTEKATFYISTNYKTQEGIVKGDKLNHLGFKANATAQATDWLKVGINANATSGTTSFVDAARNGSNFSVGGFPRLAIVNAPNIPIWNADGTPAFEQTGLGFGPNTIRSTFSNPAKILEIGNGISTDVNRLIGSMFADLTPVKGLVLRTQYGIDYARVEDRRFWSPIHGDGVTSRGLANNYAATTERWTWTNTATYSFSTGKNNFNLLAGTEASEKNNSFWSTQRSDLQDDRFTVFQGPFLNATADGEINNNTIFSYFGRVNYDYDSKYLLSLNFRRDGFSALSKSNRWGNFGGFSAAWRLSSEDFFDFESVDDLKIKASYGLVGNTNIQDYAAQSYYKTYFYGSNATYFLGQIADPNLKWESSAKYDLGLSMQLFNRLTIDVDYYYTKSSDLILEIPQAPSKGMPGIVKDNIVYPNIMVANAGTMRNSGLELTVSTDVLRSKDFTWNTSFNITSNSNKVLALTEGLNEIISSDRSGLEFNNITVPGKSIGQLYLYKTGGIDAETGRRIFYGPDGTKTLYMYEDGKRGWYTEDGKKYDSSLFEPEICGNTLPTWYGGWNNSFKYMRFDLSLFFQFSGGNYIYNGTRATASDMRYWNNSKDVLNNYWSENNKNAIYAKPIYGDNYSNGSAMPISDWVEKGDYVRLKNISVGYTFDTKKWSKSIGVSSLRVYGLAQNLFVLTGYTGMDPEVLTNVKSPSLAGGTDKNTMPQARTYTLGVNLSF